MKPRFVVAEAFPYSLSTYFRPLTARGLRVLIAQRRHRSLRSSSPIASPTLRRAAVGGISPNSQGLEGSNGLAGFVLTVCGRGR